MEAWYIEDDADVATLLADALTESGFLTRVISTGSDALELLHEFSPTILLVDWNLPDANGLDICKRARSFHPDLPIIMVTVRDDPADVVACLQAGADDYVTKPFDLQVLLSRVKALLRRTAGGMSTLTCGELRLEVDRALAFKGVELLDLTATEYQLLHMFMRNKGRIVTRDAIREELWGIDGVLMSDNTLTVAIKRLRSKLGDANCIKTVRSFGYRLEETS